MERNISKAAAADLNPARSGARKVRGLIRRARLRAKAGFRRTDTDRLTREIRAAVRRDDWDRANSIAARWAKRAERTDDRQLLERVGNDLRRLRYFERSFAVLAQCKRRDGPKEWDGTDPKGKVLLIERRDGDLATFFLFLSAIDLGLASGARCIVLVEDRLIPLFSRTFPRADIRSEASQRDTALAESDVVTSFEAVAHYLGWDGVQRRRLAHDTDAAGALRRRYRADTEQHLVGITWGSLNVYKDTPGIEDWRGLFDKVPARYVSLQYGEVEPTIRAFERPSADPILVDPAIDQLTDMDLFASQVASLDAVVTISNTVAHMAGVMGVPTFVVLDGQFKRSWPGLGTDVPWYESARLARRNASGWTGAFDAAEAWLLSTLVD